MPQFKCAECGHEFDVAQTTGGADLGMKCPHCGGAAHRPGAGGPLADHGASQRGGARRGASQRRGGQRAGKDRDDD